MLIKKELGCIELNQNKMNKYIEMSMIIAIFYLYVIVKYLIII